MYFLYKLRWSLNVPNHILAQSLVYDNVFMLVKEKGTNLCAFGRISLIPFYLTNPAKRLIKSKELDSATGAGVD